jgi:GT2 family glycosyltransferase
METIAPPVVAVIVTCDPGEWFEETLQAFAAQDYPELSVLVLDAASWVDPTPRVAAVLPQAFVRRLPDNKGFGATANEVLTMVEGASHLVFCHDDVAPDPDAVHVMVEESFRSNAGVVAPKLVSWHDPRSLLHVGMAVDKGGAVVDRVEPGEIDHGQHDAVRDVFLAPGGCTLVRADLFEELGGFDAEIFAMGEDLDLCWRAQVLGARVVVAPRARVRHLEVLASGRRNLPLWVRLGAPARHAPTSNGATARGALPSDPSAHVGARAGAGDGAPPDGAAGNGAAGNGAAGNGAAGNGAVDQEVLATAAVTSIRRGRGSRSAQRGVPRVTLQSLQRRHELHATLKAYGPFHLARVLPQVVVLAVAETIVAVVARQRDRAAAVAHAWRWNLARRKTLRVARSDVRAHRRLDDAEVRRLQLHGSARLNAYLRRAVTHGLQSANVGEASGDHQTAAHASPAVEEQALPAERGAGPASSTRWMVWLAVTLVIVLGTRQLIGSGLPFVGQFLPMPSWSTLMHRYLSGWQPSGVGTTDPTTPATAVLGVAGLLLGGGVGLVQKIVILGCIPLGALGMARLTRPLGTSWARVTSTIVYLAIPVPYDAIATGRWDALVVYAACPWILDILGRSSRVAPYATSASTRPWRHSLLGHSLALGVIVAVATSLAPAVVSVTLVVAGGLALGHVVVAPAGGWRAAGRALAVAGGATGVSLILLAPWSFALLGGSGRWQMLTGLPVQSSTAAGWGELLRMGIGPLDHTALAWAFLAAAALPLVIGRRSRLAWAARTWCIAVVAWLVAWASGHGWFGPVSFAPQLLLAPAGAGMAMSVGLGVSAFQLDLPGYRFGWRQATAVAAAAAAVVGLVPVFLASLGGRWDLVPTGYGQVTSWMSAQHGNGQFRVLWLGDPRVLPGAGWSLAPGLAYSVSENGLPDATALWPGSSSGAASALGSAITLAERGSTVRLGRLLAPYAVRYVVVVETLGPSVPGLQSPPVSMPPAGLVPALASQVDLRQVISQGGFLVFADDDALPVYGTRSAASATASPVQDVAGPSPGLVGWHAVLPGAAGADAITGVVPSGTVFAGVAPPAAWRLLRPEGGVERPSTAFGYAASFAVARPGPVTVEYSGSWAHGAEIGAQMVLWLVVAAAFAGRRAWLDWWWVRLRRRGSPRHARGSSADGVGPTEGDTGTRRVEPRVPAPAASVGTEVR